MSQAVEQALEDVRAMLASAAKGRRITGAEMWDLRLNIEAATEHRSFGGGQLRAYARELADLAKVKAPQLVAGDRIFNTLYRRWHEVQSVRSDGELVRVTDTNRYEQAFVRNLKVIRLPKSTETSSALSELVGR
jgi:hypothetical protein